MSFCTALCAAGWSQPVLFAQAVPQGPMEAPEDHHVTRISAEPRAVAPPSLPPLEILKRLAQKEDEYQAARARYSFRKTVRIQEFGPDGNPAGELLRVADYRPAGEGKIAIRVVQKPQSTLQNITMESEDFTALDRIPAYPFTSDQLPKYDFKYLGQEQVDEIDCYIFQSHPKTLDRKQGYFDGVFWVDAKYLDVVKTYGKWVNDQGPIHAVGQLPFALFETYRENTDGKFWFPNYSRSDDTLHFKDSEVSMRLVIKWTDFKLASAAESKTASVPAPAPPQAQPTAPATAKP
ncbi:MAG: hypothetical protein NVS9B4_10820 [Candidatus Acidiferrum sp.]